MSNLDILSEWPNALLKSTTGQVCDYKLVLSDKKVSHEVGDYPYS